MMYANWVDAMGWSVREYEIGHTGPLLPCPHANMAEHLVLCPAHPMEQAMCSTCTANHLESCERLCVRCAGAMAKEFWHNEQLDDISITRGADQFVWPVTALWVPLCKACGDWGEAVTLRKKAMLTDIAVRLMASPHQAGGTQYPVGAHVSGQWPDAGVHMDEAGVRAAVDQVGDKDAAVSCDCCQRQGTVGGWPRDGLLVWHNELPLRLRFDGRGGPAEVLYRGLLNVYDLARVCDDCAWFWLDADLPSMDVRRAPAAA
jgi:hypothetical protein